MYMVMECFRIGQALEQDPGHLKSYRKNEQGMAHAAIAFC